MILNRLENNGNISAEYRLGFIKEKKKPEEKELKLF